MDHIVKIISTEHVTHNVKHFVVEKPEGFEFVPGQATDLSINEPEWKDNKHPFTFTSLNDKPHLEFTIKIYDNPHGVTHHLGQLEAGAELIISDAWGAIEYKGPGYFIAGGAGITPFIAILRQQYKDRRLDGNTLFFSNKADQDIILKDELEVMLGTHAHFTITNQKDSRYDQRRINADFLKAEVKDFKKHFYVCGPDQMVLDINKTLGKLGAKPDSLVFEK
ncbi:MAG: oxidoreductase FAD/NAD(P)-binding domain protein [Mucilaginibacter sp.]|nr:oxidoreductase FAD/NAD(P)-binding domain protein [Mucilaginibacter sp.]